MATTEKINRGTSQLSAMMTEDTTSLEPEIIKSTNKAAHIYALSKGGVLQGAGTYNTTEVKGCLILLAGTAGNLVISPVNGDADVTIPYTSIAAGMEIWLHADSVAVPTGGSVLLYKD